MPIGLKEIKQAMEVIHTSIDHTPLIPSRFLSAKVGAPVFLKLENLQRTGSFKIRGAFNKLNRLASAEGKRGVVAASAGNHAPGVSFAAHALGIPSIIVMPEGSSIAKQEATRSYGAKVLIAGKDFDEAMKRAKEIARSEGRVLIHAFDDEAIIAGQGTVGLEILKECPDVATLIVPIGGGGIASGVAIAAKSMKAGIQVVGVKAAARPSLADGIAVKALGRKTKPLLNRYLDQTIDVSEAEIAEAILMFMERKRIIAEGAGAVSLAALLNHDCRIRGPVCVIVSGGNIDVTLLERIIERGLVRTGRLLRFSVVLLDRPSALATLSTVIGTQGANILHIVHDRLSSDLPITQSRVHLSLETRGPAHNRKIMSRLKQMGYPLSRKR